jgi:hypothetical protein
MFNASTFVARGIDPWHAAWFNLCIDCLDVCYSSLHWSEPSSSSVPRIVGSPDVHWDGAVVPTVGCIQGIVLHGISLIEGSIPVKVSTRPLKVWVVVVALVVQIEWAL